MVRIDVVEPGRRLSDQGLASFGFADVDVLPSQDFGTAHLANPDYVAHASTPTTESASEKTPAMLYAAYVRVDEPGRFFDRDLRASHGITVPIP